MNAIVCIVRIEGLEPPRPFDHEHLKLARLPLRHIRVVGIVHRIPWWIALESNQAARRPRLSGGWGLPAPLAIQKKVKGNRSEKRLPFQE